jgi:hypothetical protein
MTLHWTVKKPPRSSIEDLIRFCYEREVPFDPTQWHEWNTLLWPVRAIGGGWTIGRTWRRLGQDGWEFRPREESYEDWAARQW